MLNEKIELTDIELEAVAGGAYYLCVKKICTTPGKMYGKEGVYVYKFLGGNNWDQLGGCSVADWDKRKQRILERDPNAVFINKDAKPFEL